MRAHSQTTASSSFASLCRKLWDMGLYVAITSVAPLRFYLYDDLLLRHCSRNYTRDLAAAHPDSYVVAEDYSPPWAIESLRTYYARGFSTLNVLRAYMRDNGAHLTTVISQVARLLATRPAARL